MFERESLKTIHLRVLLGGGVYHIYIYINILSGPYKNIVRVDNDLIGCAHTSLHTNEFIIWMVFFYVGPSAHTGSLVFTVKFDKAPLHN